MTTISGHDNHKLNKVRIPQTARSHWSSVRPIDVKLDCLNKTNIRDYEIICLIGQGSFGVVKRAKYRPNGLQVAIKQYETKKLFQELQRVEALKQECQVLSKLKHDGIMGFVDSIKEHNKVHVIVEYINGNNLYQYIRKLPESRIKNEEEVKVIFKKVLESVKYMHDQNVIHRDLKLENVLIDRKT